MKPSTKSSKSSKSKSKSGKKKTVSKTTGKPLKYVLKDNFLQVIYGGEPFTLNSTHPTFERLAAALRRGSWAYVPKLISLARHLLDVSAGRVRVVGGKVFFKDMEVDDQLLTADILKLAADPEEVKSLLLFLDNLYENSSPEARAEFYPFWKDARLPLTDDGCFLAYKSVNNDFTDKYSGKVDNSVGNRILGSRKWFDEDYRTQCSRGYHVCSRQYGMYGERVLAVKVNPRDVLSANGGKMRVVNYEVLADLGRDYASLFREQGFPELEGKIKIAIKAERQELIQFLLAAKSVKALVRRKKIKTTTIKKMTYGQLQKMAARHNLLPTDTLDADRPLEAARKAAGLMVGEVSKKLGKTYKETVKLERQKSPGEGARAAYLRAVAELCGIKDVAHSGISFPRPSFGNAEKRKRAAMVVV
jgi:hypothetical protein